MQRVRRILVPLDLHYMSEAKLPVAEAQAHAFKAELILLHVLPSEKPGAETVSSAEAQARSYLDAIATRLSAEGLVARPLVRWGTPGPTIVAEIAVQDVDLVVLGTSSRQGLRKWLLGSVAESILANATCPVLLAPTPEGDIVQPPAVRSFDDDAHRAGAVAPRLLGIRTVEVARIVGSVGRASELDTDFRTPKRRSAHDSRYDRVRALVKSGERIPPVILYKLGYGYYVLDGNHRVAAAKELGQLEIDAEVTEFIPLGDAKAQRLAAERRAFERETGLRRIGVTVVGHYQRLEELIHRYARAHAIDDIPEAARRWEVEVYRPAAERIRRRRTPPRSPGERTADVFVRMIDDAEARAVFDDAAPLETSPTETPTP